MTHENVRRMEKLCYEAQLKLEEAGRILCPETGEAANLVRGRLDKAIGNVEEVIHSCYMLHDPVEPFYDNSAEDPGDEDGNGGKQ